MSEIDVYKNRTNVIDVDLGDLDVSSDTIVSEIREEAAHYSKLIATWAVTFTTDGTDGQIQLTLTKAQTASIKQDYGWMDFKHIQGASEFSVLGDPVKVVFKDTVTA